MESGFENLSPEDLATETQIAMLNGLFERGLEGARGSANSCLSYETDNITVNLTRNTSISYASSQVHMHEEQNKTPRDPFEFHRHEGNKTSIVIHNRNVVDREIGSSVVIELSDDGVISSMLTTRNVMVDLFGHIGRLRQMDNKPEDVMSSQEVGRELVCLLSLIKDIDPFEISSEDANSLEKRCEAIKNAIENDSSLKESLSERQGANIARRYLGLCALKGTFTAELTNVFDSSGKFVLITYDPFETEIYGPGVKGEITLRRNYPVQTYDEEFIALMDDGSVMHYGDITEYGRKAPIARKDCSRILKTIQTAIDIGQT